MGSGTYLALSGLQTRIEQLDRLSADIANANTAGYKGQETTTDGSVRPTFDQTLKTAVDPTLGPVKIDFQTGTIKPTGRPLDFAINGSGFFVLDTPAGVQYTRNGSFNRRADGVLVSSEDQSPVEGVNGKPITLPPSGSLSVDPDGTVRVDGAMVGQIKVVDFADYSKLQRESASRFVPVGETPTLVKTPTIAAGALEQSNVSVVDSMAQLVDLSRSFDSLNKGISVLLNQVDSQAISQLGKP
ncbi:MAG TPA: flagellar hook basal-body protein [Vicinamibacterales bacterium]|nr:flagellar hook basal-body protein [Vicinamibacterales bacterium]